MAIKAIVLDLDGTLLKNKWKVDSYSLKVIKRIYQEKPDIKIIIATGRAPGATIKHAKTCLIDKYAGHIICYNGGSIIDIRNNKIESLFEKSLSKTDVNYIFDYAKKHNLNFWGYGTDNKTAYVDKSSIRVWAIEHFNKLERKFMNINNIVELYKVLLFCHGRKDLLTNENELLAKTNLEVSWSSNRHPVIEINPNGVNKAEAVQFLCKKWNIKREEVLACGDGMNDYKMLKWVKYGIAMENGFSELKAIAYDVTNKNKRGGVGKALEKYVFND